MANIDAVDPTSPDPTGENGPAAGNGGIENQSKLQAEFKKFMGEMAMAKLEPVMNDVLSAVKADP